jgi:sulfopyruvate decarboxylase subunit beta
MLMNLGSLSTLARYRPRNLTVVIFDNESLLSVGGFPTATSTGTDLAGIARASGVEQTTTAKTVQDFSDRFKEAINVNDLTVLVAKVDAVGPAGFHMDLALLENRFQFQRHIKSLEDK